MYRIAVIELVVVWCLWSYPFLRRRFSGPKRESNVMAPEGKWGLLLQAASLFLAWVRLYQPGVAAIIASMILAPLATVFAWLAVRHLGKQFRILAGLYPDHELVRTGVYGIVRHPIYASMFAMMLATGLLFTRWPMLLLATALYVAGTEIRIRAEESLLRARFGEEFEDYRRKVPAYVPIVR